jgi:PAS domain S-box-containing protein
VAVGSEERVAELERALAETRRELEAMRGEAASGSFFRRVIETNTEAVLVVDRNGVVTYASPAYEVATGRPASEFVGKQATAFTHADALVHIQNVLSAILSSKPDAVERFEGRHQARDGRWMHTEIVARNLLHDPVVNGILLVGRDVSQRKQAETKLSDSERMFRALFEDTSIAVTIRDVDTQQFIDCNTAALRLYGFETREELRGSTPDQVAPPTQPDGRASRDALREYVTRALRDGTAHMDWMARRRDGELFPAEVRTTVIALGDGRRVMQTMIEDVTERDEQLRAIEEQARRDDLVSRVSRRFVQAGDVALPFALEALGSFLGADRVRLRWLVDGGATLVTVEEWCAPGVPVHPNPRDSATGIFSYVLDRLGRHGYLAVDDVATQPESLRSLHRAARPDLPTRALLFLPVSNQGVVRGYLVVEHVQAARYWSEDDIATARLITEIIAMGRARAEAEERTRRRAAHDELLSEVSRRFLNEDPSAATDVTVERLGQSLDAESVRLFALDEGTPRLRCTHRWLASGSSPGVELLEAEHPIPSGALASWLETLQSDSGRRELYAPVGSSGQFFGLLALRAREGRAWTEDDAATLRMIGELIAVGRVRRAAELALARATEDAIAANLTKSAFLANMSHELRTPLNGVIGMVDLLASTQLDERQRRYTEIARASASLLLSVISDILDFSKIEAGRLELEAVPVNINDIVEEVASILALSAEEKGLELSCHSDAALATPFLGDPARIRQVLVNLVSNAVKFTKHGEVSVRASVVSEPMGGGARVRVEVRDSGIGIPAEAQGKLFRPFTQVDASTTRVHGGTGLGLAICRELVERMHGTIGLESTQGSGSTFWFEVPLARSAERINTDAGTDRQLAGVRVLGVDDNATNRELLRAQLAAAGMVCEVAADGRTALQMLFEAAKLGQPFALAVIDHHMPVMDGRELARRVKADPHLAATRVVMLGSVADPLSASEQRVDGIVAYHTKPIWKKDLLRVLRTALEERENESAREPGAAAPSSPPLSAPGARVLIVEDSQINAEVAGEILRAAGYAFDVAADGALAVDAVKSRSYALVLMDCQLPGVDGYEATRRIRALERQGVIASQGGAIPIVALTASATREDLERCFAAGMDDYVSKPVDARRLLAIIAARLNAGVPAARVTTPRPPTIPVANIAQAVERLAGDRELFGRIAALFAHGAPAVRAKLRAAVESRDRREVVFATHRLKGQASTFGGDALIATAEALGEAASATNWSATEAMLIAVEKELDRLLRALARAEEGPDHRS